MKLLNKGIVSFFAAVFVTSLLFVTGCSSSKVASGNGKQLVMDSAIKQGKLDNGMSYFIRENGEPKNRIQLRLVVKAGSCMEEDDQKGVAHFVEHMCFNGTEHFEKSAIVDYFESIGMQFGPEVNAYTSFEETVYMLELPADDPEILKTSLMVLHDWASAVSFNPEEIDKERGVIVEEWRLRNQGLNGRVTDKLIPLIFKDSRFEGRLPIGSMDVVKNASYDRIKDFYKKWYRPELMSVVAVGDAKSEVLEKAIKEVMGTIPASEKKIKSPEFKVPLQSKKKIEIMRDKELNILQVEIYQQAKDNSPVTTVEQLRKEYALNIAASVLNMRCQEISNQPSAEWLGAGVGSTGFANNNPIYVMQLFPKTDRFEQAFKAFLDEYERFMLHGITEAELNRAKQSMLQSFQQNYANKDKHPSANFAGSIVSHIVSGRIYLSDEDAFKLDTEITNQITAEEILEVAKEAFENRGTLMLVLVPESMNVPSEKEILDIWNNYESESAKEAYVDDTGDNKLMDKPSKKAKVTEKKAIKELGGTQYTFENGVKIITKKTDFQKDSIVVYGGSKGGYYQLKEEEIPSAKIAREYALYSGFNGKTLSQIKKIAAPLNLNIGFEINNTEECFYGNANKSNIEETLQYINIAFDKPQFTEEGWTTLINQYKQVAENYGAQPSRVFNDKINEMLYGNNLYFAPWNMDYINKMNPEIAERVYRERFGNPADFTFVFVGDFDEKKLVDLCAYYLGTLKTNDVKEETKYVYFPFPETSKTATVKKGIDQKGEVYMCFGGELPECKDLEISYKEGKIIDQLASVLDIRLREVIREDKGGSYGVSTGGFIDGWPERFYKVYIDFGCEPAREEELQAVVIETIKDIQSGNISDELIQKLKETYTRTIETSVRNNYWWLNRIGSEILFTYEPLWYTNDTGRVNEWITKEALVEAANKYLDTNRIVTGYLKPEK